MYRTSNVKKHKRHLKSGLIVDVHQHTRNIPINGENYEPISNEWAEKFNRERLVKNHPDTVNIARITFLRPNNLWAEHPEKYDVLNLDSLGIPVYEKMLDSGLPGQIIKVKGINYLADEDGIFMPYSFFDGLIQSIDKNELDKYFIEIEGDYVKKNWREGDFFGIDDKGHESLIEDITDIDSFKMFAIEKPSDITNPDLSVKEIKVMIEEEKELPDKIIDAMSIDLRGKYNEMIVKKKNEFIKKGIEPVGKKIKSLKKEIDSLKKALDNPKLSKDAQINANRSLVELNAQLVDLVWGVHPKMKELQSDVKKLEGEYSLIERKIRFAYEKGVSKEKKDKLVEKSKELLKKVKLKKEEIKEVSSALMGKDTIKKKKKPGDGKKEYFDSIKYKDARANLTQQRQEVYYAEKDIEEAEKKGESKERIAYLRKILERKQEDFKVAQLEKEGMEKLPRKPQDTDYYSQTYGINLAQIKDTIKRGDSLSKEIFDGIDFKLKEKYIKRKEEINKIQEKFKRGEDITNDEIQRLPFLQQQPIIDLQWERRRARNKTKEIKASSKYKKAVNKLKNKKNNFYGKDDITDVEENIVQEIDGAPVIMDNFRLSLLTTPEWIDQIGVVGKSALVNKTNVKTIDKYVIGVSGDRFLLTKNKFALYDVDKIEKVIKKMDEASLEIYYGTGSDENTSPIIIKDKDLAYALAPRSCEDDETGRISPFSTEIEITKEEWDKWNKYTKEELLQLSEPSFKKEKTFRDEGIKGQKKGESLYKILSKKDDKDFEKALKERKKDMKLKGKIKGIWYRDSNNFGNKTLMRGDRIAVITDNEDFNKSNFHADMNESEYKEIDNNKSSLKFIQDDLLLVTPDKKSSYRYDLIKEALKEVKKDATILYKRDHPLVIRGEEKTVAIAPRVEEGELKEGFTIEPDIPMKDFNRLNKLTKKELAKKCGYHDESTKVSGSKESWIIGAYENEKGKEGEK